MQQSWFCKLKLFCSGSSCCACDMGLEILPSLSSATYYWPDASDLLSISFPWEVLELHWQALMCTSLHNNLLSWVTIFFSLWIRGHLLKLWVVLAGHITDFEDQQRSLLNKCLHSCGWSTDQHWRRKLSLFYFMINKQALTNLLKEFEVLEGFSYS